ncbi:peptide ABC transporter substrate-binding protein [Bacillus sp. 1NLA3E]|uniref:peptide ABC transporter substrate-binding protein n=1 Tax=Bacillus sp. 1NLA3E TaxID=666686 RepID=UPI000247EC3D|nr:peptide ABC transporter substrate-binding protein [Bacillus sp. 1NLA3E]AGK55734.1 ABC transporter substrate-binding protein [Bacillus sp. 1NLA3E]
MKKNIIFLLSMVLILSMFLSMFYTAFFGKNENAKKVQIPEYVDQDLKININTEPTTLHPGLAADSVSGSVLLQTFEGLTRIDLWGRTVNAAASVVKISDDQKTYSFTLRDAKWTNGDPVIAKDFEFAWKWLLNPANHSENASQLYYIKGAEAFNKGKDSVEKVGVRAIDDKTLEVKLVNPTPNFLDLISKYTYFPINSKVAEKNPNWANEAGKQYTSNGPFELTEWTHNNKIVLKRNKNYWDTDTVRLKSISMLMVNDPNTELSMYENGELNLTGSPVEEVPSSDITQSIDGMYTLKLNTKFEPFNNKNIRKAFAFALNRQELVEHTKQMKSIPALATVPPALFQGNKKSFFKDNDVEKAKQCLQKGIEELGYKDTSELPVITLLINTNQVDKRIAQSIQDMWRKNLGVNVTLDSSSWNIQNEKVHTLDYEVSLMESLSSYSDPVNVLEPFLNANSINNGTGWENKEFQSLIRQSQIETDINKRQKLLKNAEGLLIEDMPVIPVSFFKIDLFQSENVRDVAVSKLGYVQYKWAHLEK